MGVGVGMMEGAALALAQARERGRAGFSLASAVGTIFFFFCSYL